MAPQTQSSVVDWRFLPAWRLILLLLLVILFSAQLSFHVSPFINSVHDLLHPKSAWYELLEYKQPGTLQRILISLLYLLMAYAFFMVYHAFAENKLIGEIREIYLEWNPWKLGWKKYLRSALLFLLTAFVSSAEIIWLEQLNGHLLSTIGLLMRCASIIVLAGLVLRFFLQDYLKRLLNYVSYFYPSIVSIAILAFVLSRLDQIDSIMIHMVQSWWNLALFLPVFSSYLSSWSGLVLRICYSQIEFLRKDAAILKITTKAVDPPREYYKTGLFSQRFFDTKMEKGRKENH